MSPAPARWQVRTARPVAYDLIKAPELFARGATALAGCGRRGGRRFVVIDAHVDHHFGARIRAWFREQGIEARISVFPGGEERKTVATWQALLRELDDFPIHRRDEPIIAIGGGVLTDVVGFVAASYRRGVPHVKVPTTLMGYVDAAVGVKVGINFNARKNRLGAFEPPAAVFLDKAFLATLPRRHLLNGVGEIIKLAVVCDRELFERLEHDGAACVEHAFASPAGDVILDRSIGGMLAELTPNLFEAELARSVDFGHTFSYGLEVRHEDRLLHGEAVLLDVLVSSVIAARRQLLEPAALERIYALVSRLGFALDLGLVEAESMWRALEDRVEHRNGHQHIPLPAGIGQCSFINDLTRAELDAAVAALHSRSKANHEPALQC